MPQGVVMDLVLLFFVSGVVGARFFYILQHWPDYAGRPERMLAIREGGLVWYGGFAAAVLSGVVTARLKRWPVLALADFFAPLLPLGHAIGRIGCFLNGCCYGRVTKSFDGMVFPGDSFRRLPVQLYEAAALLILSFFLFFLFRRKRQPGEIFLSYLLFYGAMRFGAEFLRGDQVPVFYLTLPQWMSGALFLGAAVLLWVVRSRRA